MVMADTGYVVVNNGYFMVIKPRLHVSSQLLVGKPHVHLLALARCDENAPACRGKIRNAVEDDLLLQKMLGAAWGGAP